jgi:hypothetical protein
VGSGSGEDLREGLGGTTGEWGGVGVRVGGGNGAWVSHVRVKGFRYGVAGASCQSVSVISSGLVLGG